MALCSLWIKTAVSLPRHPKVRSLAATLNISAAEAVGRLVMLWIYALEFRGDGVFQSAAEIAEAMDWHSTTPEALLEALIQCGGNSAGFIEISNEEDGVIFLHDWQDFSGSTSGASSVRIPRGPYKKKREENKKEVKSEAPKEQFRSDAHERIVPIDANHAAWLKSLGKI